MERITLFCAPHAGAGAATFRDWQRHLPAWLELVALQLPGRGAKYAIPPIRDWNTLRTVLLDQVTPKLAGPFAIFGHSMGALIGLELAHAIRSRHGLEPIWLGASACTAPSRRSLESDWLTRPRETVIERLRMLGGTSEEVLRDSSLLDALLPVLRADFHLCGTYESEPRAPLSAPLLVLGGTADEVSSPRENLSAWSREASGDFQLEMVDGGHFFIEANRQAVIRRIVEAIADVVARVNAVSSMIDGDGINDI